MGGICGWLGQRNQEPEAGARIDAMAQTLARFDHSSPSRMVCDRAAIAASGLAGTGTTLKSGNRCAAAWGTPRFSAREGDLATALTRWQGDGADSIRALGGSSALALIDEDRQEAVLAVDRMATRPLFYCSAGGRLVFGTTIDAILAAGGIPSELDNQGIFNYVYFHMVPGPGTIYRNIHRILPGELLHWRNGSAQAIRYWDMRFDEQRPVDFGALKKDMLDTLRQAVGDAASGAVVGSFMSGGTDSSTVAGLLGQVTGQRARTYSIGFDSQGYDEMEYARIAAKHFNTDHHEYYVTPADIVDAIPKIASVYDQPFGNSSAVPSYYCAKLAREDGVQRLLGGDGGDELFGGNTRYARQWIFSLYGNLPSWTRAIIEPLACGIPGGERIPPLRKLRSYIEQANVPMPARLETYNLVNRLTPGRIFTPEFLSSIDSAGPLGLLEGTYRLSDGASLINRMLALDRYYTLADNDLPKVNRMCELAGVDVAYPMLDERVVEFSLRLAPDLKLKGTKLRYFFKEALRDFLPEQIINKQKHGFGLPFGPWLTVHMPLQDLVFGTLQNLKKRNIVRPGLIDELVSTRISEHADYFGTMAWVLMMLEQWMETRTGAR